MTKVDPASYNAAIETVRAIARAAADRIEATANRPIAEGFAVAALRQLEHDAAQLLVPLNLKASAPISNGQETVGGA